MLVQALPHSHGACGDYISGWRSLDRLLAHKVQVALGHLGPSLGLRKAWRDLFKGPAVIGDTRQGLLGCEWHGKATGLDRDCCAGFFGLQHGAQAAPGHWVSLVTAQLVPEGPFQRSSDDGGHWMVPYQAPSNTQRVQDWVEIVVQAFSSRPLSLFSFLTLFFSTTATFDVYTEFWLLNNYNQYIEEIFYFGYNEHSQGQAFKASIFKHFFLYYLISKISYKTIICVNYNIFKRWDK